jgi:hypothetical protein
VTVQHACSLNFYVSAQALDVAITTPISNFRQRPNVASMKLNVFFAFANIFLFTQDSKVITKAKSLTENHTLL